MIKSFPEIGKPTSQDRIRIKVVENYLIIYEDLKDSIHVLRIWDSRRDPGAMGLSPE